MLFFLVIKSVTRLEIIPLDSPIDFRIEPEENKEWNCSLHVCKSPLCMHETKNFGILFLFFISPCRNKLHVFALTAWLCITYRRAWTICSDSYLHSICRLWHIYLQHDTNWYWLLQLFSYPLQFIYNIILLATLHVHTDVNYRKHVVCWAYSTYFRRNLISLPCLYSNYLCFARD